MVNYTVVNLARIAAALVLTTLIIERTSAKETNTDAVPEGGQAMNVMVDVNPSRPHSGTTLASSLRPLMQTVGRSEWTMARLQGVMGHAFHFEMVEGGKGVMHDNIDWGLALDFLPNMAQFRTFQATKHDTDIDLPALKREAREAVRASLQQGVPAMVWQPMSLEQKASDHPAHHAYCWGLIVGYNQAEETYTIRHPFVGDTYTVRYDAIGHSDGVEWFNVTIYDQPSNADEKATQLTALRNAVAFANGTRYTDERFIRHNGKRSIPYGFAAYELWREAFESEDVSPGHSHHHAEILRARRLTAAAYLRELVTLFPVAAEPLEAAAVHYDLELEALNPLYGLCSTAEKVNGFTLEDRAAAGKLIGDALKADREAIASIEAALALVDRS